MMTMTEAQAIHANGITKSLEKDETGQEWRTSVLLIQSKIISEAEGIELGPEGSIVVFHHGESQVTVL